MSLNWCLDFQVNVAQERLSTFLALAERLQVRGLTIDLNDGQQPQRLVHGLDFDLPPGSLTGLVGASGSGEHPGIWRVE